MSVSPSAVPAIEMKAKSGPPREKNATLKMIVTTAIAFVSEPGVA